MSYFINNLKQKIAYKFIKGKSPGIIFIHGYASDMEGEKALKIKEFAKKKGLSFLSFLSSLVNLIFLGCIAFSAVINSLVKVSIT